MVKVKLVIDKTITSISQGRSPFTEQTNCCLVLASRTVAVPQKFLAAAYLGDTLSCWPQTDGETVGPTRAHILCLSKGHKSIQRLFEKSRQMPEITKRFRPHDAWLSTDACGCRASYLSPFPCFPRHDTHKHTHMQNN